MTIVLTTWLAFVFGAACIAWFAPRTVLPFAIVAALTLPAGFYALGHPSVSTLPTGEFEVIGARIDEDVAIYVLISGDGAEPIYYRLPYDEQTASQLQKAMDGARGNGGTVMAKIGDGQAVGFSERARPGEPPKQVERSIIGSDIEEMQP